LIGNKFIAVVILHMGISYNMYFVTELLTRF